MSVVLINPILTIGEDPVAEVFYQTLRTELEEYTDVRSLKTAMHLHSASIQPEEVLVIFNNKDNNYSENILAFLRQAIDKVCFIIPVALYKELRYPADIISHLQSFEVVDQLRQRRLTHDNIDTVAFALTRLVMSKVQPTMSVDRMDIFISHRRADGEDLAAGFYNELRRRADEVEAFRDIISIKVGENAQKKIEESLRMSDAVVFIDTPLCGESRWIDEELQMALGLNMPIVWVKVGPDSGRIPLKVKPAASPHFSFDYLETEDLIKTPSIIDDIIHKAFEISSGNAMSVIDHFNRLQQLASSEKIKLTPINKKNMIYRVEIPRKAKDFEYYQRSINHVLQLFGRNPKNTDRTGFEPLISELGYQLHPDLGYHFDSGLLLGPNASLNLADTSAPICVDSIDRYVTSLQKYITSDRAPLAKKGIIISGAFPDFEPEFQQQLTNAVFAFAKAILDHGGTVIFGSHPTFQHLILDLARRERPKDYISAVHMYISKYYATQANINEITNKATVYATEDINNSREESLTAMRQAMIADDDVAGIILLGGKQHTHTKPGIEEEFELAQLKGIPAFIVGSVGGRSSELAREIIDKGGEPINSLTEEQNKKLLTSLDYRSLADEILQSLGF
ncbi:SLOG domain-containing protein [Paenibacillus typhae]|uniref:SLOG domain-containing protein n=1 Tax=Paenibacillus typhae TaxID=1174501 RepID=UPI001C8D6596|nr:TIR domain-containing protein [Paenibacillus typhae]MBY0010811.1 TIR domain-containing protein [Paenibacillus typhae]